MRADVIKAQIANQAFAIDEKVMQVYMDALNSNIPHAEIEDREANDSVEYRTVGSVAIIDIDGAMWKKPISGACGETVASYSTINKYIDDAEGDQTVKTILFIVDTPGGSVAGVDGVENRIYNSKKKTVTIFVNTGASAGVWAFMASDEVYATEMTYLGSIGVVVAYEQDEEKDKKTMVVVSKRAENKRCKLGEDCKNKIETRINEIEEVFYARVEKNTGFNAEKIMTIFNKGDVILAPKALEAGFIQGITTVKALVEVLTIEKTLGGRDTAINSSLTTAPSSNEKLAIPNQGANMTDEESGEIQSANVVLNARVETLTGRNTKLQSDLEAKTVELTALKADFDTKLSEATSKAVEDAVAVANADAEALAKTTATATTARIQEAYTMKVSAETLIEMVGATNAEASSQIALASKSNTEAISHQEGGDKDETAVDAVAWAKQREGSIL